MAFIKEYIDDKNGLLELRTTEGGHGSLILFNESQVWISNRYFYTICVFLLHFNKLFKGNLILMVPQFFTQRVQHCLYRSCFPWVRKCW